MSASLSIREHSFRQGCKLLQAHRCHTLTAVIESDGFISLCLLSQLCSMVVAMLNIRLLQVLGMDCRYYGWCAAIVCISTRINSHAKWCVMIDREASVHLIRPYQRSLTTTQWPRRPASGLFHGSYIGFTSWGPSGVRQFSMHTTCEGIHSSVRRS